MKKTMFLLVILFMGFISCSDDGGNDTAATPKTPKKIVFMGTQSGSIYSDIYVMNEDGSGLTNLTNTLNINEYYPSWSPDGQKIYFLREESSKFYLYVMNADGSGQTNVTTQDVRSFSYDVAPDGTKIAFTGYDGDNELYVVNADGSGLTKLTDNSNQDNFPSWSPDGQWIAYIFKNTSTSKVDLCKMKHDGSSILFVTESGDVAENYKPYWSPDGTKISFTRYGKFWLSTNHELFSIKSNGADMVNISNHSKDDYYPLWSPDGTKIIFISKRDGNFNIFLWRAIDPNNLQRLTDNTRDDSQPCWSPDGSRIVYASMTDDVPTKYQLFVMNADGSNKTRLIFDSTLNCQLPKWQP